MDKVKRAADICEAVANGLTLRQIAEMYGCSSGTVIAWVTATPELSEQYARAREAAADLFEADIHAAAMTVTKETAQADKVKIDALKWIAGRRAPKRYGDRVQHDIDGRLSRGDKVTEMSDDELTALLVTNGD